MEKSGEKQELWDKLRRVGKRGGHTTPVASFWRRNETGDSVHPLNGGGGGGGGGGIGGGGGGEEHDGGDLNENGPTSQFISSRKLAAALWELHRYHDDVADTVPEPPPCLRRLKVNHRRSPPPVSPHDMLPENSSNLRRHFAKTLAQNHRSIKKNPVTIPTASASPSSYGSSMEISPYKPAVSPSISIELKGGTSTELLKVLNRILRLEEQHVADTSLIKALTKELHRARSQLDQLVKHITDDKAIGKNKERDGFDELEKGMKSRLLSKSLHRELYEAKTSLARNTISKQIEKERKLERGRRVVGEKKSTVAEIEASEAKTRNQRLRLRKKSFDYPF